MYTSFFNKGLINMEKFMIRARSLTVLSFILVSASSYSAVKCGPEPRIQLRSATLANIKQPVPFL